ncbi:cellulase family glycosylhydrolase [Mesorhizobium sp. M00.F.Ca.ET.216.01.1.1]|uniref:glycoside hydrolase family 5 protein n=1 Tax=Mesorhizobium sp. M00.F.Ca.ET.216.01.1.1 TaxID=2500528 RepID=UPI000FD855ED|nr:cellulase family glycosylhydrolase [Mesorhizobium sp. M00.F.Ca.ET.216.01.1.1]TGQ42060.1 glycoside hydrolase family 5 [Mesorhizobium sp. M00.F.Ca.ET.216.01.1.1]
MKRVACVAAWVFGIVIAANAAPIPLERGVGVHEWLNWSPVEKDGAYRWPPYRSEKEWLAGNRPLTDWPGGEEFARIRSMGFDFVRLSVDPGPLLASEGAKRQQALDILAAVVRRVASTGLKVVFDLHGVTQVPAYSMEMIYGGADSEGVARYREMVVAVATMLVKVGTDKVALEPYNEPAYYPCDSSGTDDWQRIMAGTVHDIRTVSSELTVVATGACGGSIAGLVNLTPGFDDPNLYYSFHMYEPHSFTHQRADGTHTFASGLPWPADNSTPEVVTETLKAQMDAAGLSPVEQVMNMVSARAAIARYFEQNWGQSQLEASFRQAVDWAKAHDIPSRRLFMGEFGVILMSADGRMGAFDADRLRYMTAVRQVAERFSIPWSVWEYANPYGMTLILPKGPAAPDPGLMQALGLAPQ